jgi:hypothetical protein
MFSKRALVGANRAGKNLKELDYKGLLTNTFT